MVNLNEVHEAYEKWLKVTHVGRIDLGLAVALSRPISCTKLWVWIIGASGDWKTEQLIALDDEDKTTYILTSITSKTLVSGFKSKDDKKPKDLAPLLRDKLILIPEGSQLLTMNKDEKNAIFGQLRNLYDGFSGADTGVGRKPLYKNLNVSMLAACTPFIDGQRLIHEQLGTRELFYRAPVTDELTDEEIMDKVLDNVEYEKEMRLELKTITQDFLADRKFKWFTPSKDTLKTIKDLAKYVCLMRASAELDWGSGELRAQVYPEKPTRILKQFLVLYSSLKSLEDDYSDETALEVIDRVAQSSASQNRVRVLDYLIEQSKDMLNGREHITTHNICKVLKLGYKTVYAELNVLWNLDMITREEKETAHGFATRESNAWKINVNHKLIKSLGGVENKGDLPGDDDKT